MLGWGWRGNDGGKGQETVPLHNPDSEQWGGGNQWKEEKMVKKDGESLLNNHVDR